MSILSTSIFKYTIPYTNEISVGTLLISPCCVYMSCLLSGAGVLIHFAGNIYLGVYLLGIPSDPPLHILD